MQTAVLNNYFCKPLNLAWKLKYYNLVNTLMTTLNICL